jgi:hypothetical protein
MMIRLCKTALMRLGPEAPRLLSTLREREHTPIVADCLDRCTVCETGKLVATADAIPLATKTVDELLALLDELAG